MIRRMIIKPFVPRGSTVIATYSGGVSCYSQPNLCVFAHYDKDSLIEAYVVRHLAALAQHAFEIIFVSTAPELPDSERNKISTYCSLVIHRKNAGWDMGSFKEGIRAAADLSCYQKLLLTNDSVYGPLYPLDPIFEQMDQDQYDFYGVTDSHEIRYHVQSYFTIFNLLSMKISDIHDFWDKVIFLNDKDYIVRKYEIGLTQYLIKKNYKVGALCSYDSIKQAVIQDPKQYSTYSIAHYLRELKNHPLNPTHFCWDILVEKLQCPFLKVDLIKKNGMNIDRIKRQDWRAVLVERRYDPLLIDQHVSRR
jgi:lipopolysaccharide biosynthesis protein